MAENGDPLAFFSCFEKTLQLNGVDKTLYAVDSDDEIVFNNARARPSEDEGPVSDVGDNGDRGPSHPPMSEALKLKHAARA